MKSLSRLHLPAARRLSGGIVLLASILLWIPESDVVKLVIERDPVMLGRYSLDHFTYLLVTTLCLWLLAGLLFTRLTFDRVLAIQAITVLGSCILGVVIVSALSNWLVPARYQVRPFSVAHAYQTITKKSALNAGDWKKETLVGSVVHRTPDLEIRFTYDDVPHTARTYPDAPPGYPRVEGTLTTDNRGFRNRIALVQADVVTVGDSFTEGNRVSDEDAWPEVLARLSGLSVYNLGVSLMAPREYLNNFVTYGLDLKPKVLIMMFFEDNDFVLAEHDFPLRRRTLMGDSPLGSAFRTLLVQTFGSINAHAQLPDSPALSWIPAAVHGGGKVRYYALGPGRLSRLLTSRDKVAQSRPWAETTNLLRKLFQVTQDNDIRLILAYAPGVAHVVLPLIREQVTDEQLHAFTAVKRADLPPVTGFKNLLYERLDTKEQLVRDFCRETGIEFIGLTQILSERMAMGEQVYYTYDPHWTPLGQQAVGRAIARYLDGSLNHED